MRQAVNFLGAAPQLDPADPINAQIGACLPLADGGGSIAIDLARRVTANYAANPAFAGGIAGPAVALNGSTQYVATNLSSTKAPGNSPSGSLSIWAMPYTAYNSGTDRVLFGQIKVGTSNWGASVYYDNNWYVGNYVSTRIQFAASAANWTQNKWQFYCFTWDATGAWFWRNGLSIGSSSAQSTSTTTLPALGIGAFDWDTTGYQDPFSGRLALFRFHRRKLRDPEVQRLYSQPLAGIWRPRRYVFGGSPAAAIRPFIFAIR